VNHSLENVWGLPAYVPTQHSEEEPCVRTRIRTSAADKIDEATEATGGVAKQVGDAIGTNKEKIGDFAADAAEKLGGGGGGDAG